ncbi:MAG TPA: M20 aminoacylase family protein [Burkholderiaceae bacterium]|nr:M20 aminoacylase family protein [Burkholderiaceae bacterium]
MNAYLGAALKSPVSFVQERHETLAAIRRDLHAHPELGYEEHRTAALVAERLHQWGIEVHTGVGRTGVVGVIRGRQDASGRSVGLRADMDALPIQEENEFAHRSTRPGLMHGCGHDGHTTMLLGAAQYLASTRNFDGSVFLIFQPGEEGFAGARTMIEDGLFERFPANEVYALHNWPGLPAGHIGLNPGPMMAAADKIEITICGRGGHAAHPQLSVDPVLIAGHIITSVQSIVARNVAPIETAVVSLCAIQAGHPGAFSVIPREARLIGTVRTFQHSIQTMVEHRLREIVHSTAKAFGGEATLKYERVYPATINHAPQYDHAVRVAEDLVGRDHVVRQMPPSMGAEDFSFMLQAKPGCYARLGQGTGEGSCFLHNTRYDFNDAVIPLGAGFLAALAERRVPLAT